MQVCPNHHKVCSPGSPLCVRPLYLVNTINDRWVTQWRCNHSNLYIYHRTLENKCFPWTRWFGSLCTCKHNQIRWESDWHIFTGSCRWRITAYTVHAWKHVVMTSHVCIVNYLVHVLYNVNYSYMFLQLVHMYYSNQVGEYSYIHGVIFPFKLVVLITRIDRVGQYSYFCRTSKATLHCKDFGHIYTLLTSTKPAQCVLLHGYL